jgi:hypothetical protein
MSEGSGNRRLTYRTLNERFSLDINAPHPAPDKASL